ncbi:hypothetical protein PIB30_017702 [Stylosanthes scabra]|uniref:Uncharacterized protein n=1 Tax=Stylosanthes scabra TaxID=79078 RepID=A0ABU6Q7P0_9FABA|nr:hypothetical protein [Stylosanthes scabra]
MSKLRQQLLKLVFYQSSKAGFEEYSWIHVTLEDAEHAWRVSSKKCPLQTICAGWADRVAKRIKATDGDTTLPIVVGVLSLSSPAGWILRWEISISGTRVRHAIIAIQTKDDCIAKAASEAAAEKTAIGCYSSAAVAIRVGRETEYVNWKVALNITEAMSLRIHTS